MGTRKRPGRRGAAQALVFVIVASFVGLAPGYHAIFGARSRYLRDWELFHELGVGLVVAEFSVRAEDGRLTAIDRYLALGYQDRKLAPRWLRTMIGEGGVALVARKLCERLGPVDLRANARIATMAGWVPAFAGEDDLCQPLPPRPVEPSRRMRSHGDR